MSYVPSAFRAWHIDPEDAAFYFITDASRRLQRRSLLRTHGAVTDADIRAVRDNELLQLEPDSLHYGLILRHYNIILDCLTHPEE